MAIEPGVWGIDLGQCALKALRLENVDGQVTATAFDYVEHPKILSQPDADPDQLIREALEKFLSRNSLRGDLVAIGIPGQSGLARFVKLPPVEEKKIGDIVRFEAKQQIPFNLEEVVWDYQKLGSGAVTDGFAMETEIGLFAIKRDTVTRYLQHFKDVNVEVHIVQMAPLALCNFVSYDLLEKTEAEADDEEATQGKKRCIVALDIGADNSNLVITDGQRIIWQRPIPLGGNHFTRALTKDLKLTFAKAEHLKRHATKSPELKQILSSLKPVLNDFVGEVQRSLGYFTNTHRDAYVQYMMGLGNAFRLPGMQKFLGEKLQLEVRKLQKLERLDGEGIITSSAYTENVLSFGVAYGLALQGLGVARLHTNLLPQDIQIDRLIRAKKPWAAAAAAALLLGTTVLTLGYHMQHQAVASDPVKAAMKRGEEVKSKADRFEKDVQDVKSKIDEDKKAVKSIVAGNDERLNWMEFDKFVDEALPRPDGTNLSDEAKKLFWPRGQEAYAEFMMQETGRGKAAEKRDEEEWRKDLIQANIESVYCLYSDDLSGYYNAVKSEFQRKELWDVLSKQKSWTTELKDKGWLVEIHGYTYHRGGPQFVDKAIVDNLARLPIKEGKDQPAAAGQADSSKAAAGTTTASTAEPSTTDTAGGEDANKPKDQVENPIWNKVSHVVLYNYAQDTSPDAAQFQILNNNVIDQFAAGAATYTANTPNPANPGGTSSSGPVSTASSWAPLGEGFASSGGGGIFGGGGPPGRIGGGFSYPGGHYISGPRPGGPSGPMGRERRGYPYQMPGRFPGPPRPGVMSSGPVMPMGRGPNIFARSAEPAGNETAEGKKALQRTEFVILFAWKEPTPSDQLLPQDETATSDTSSDSGSATSGSGATGSPVAPSAPGSARPVGGK
jgi:type IV pilus assembly protein PilM